MILTPVSPPVAPPRLLPLQPPVLGISNISPWTWIFGPWQCSRLNSVSVQGTYILCGREPPSPNFGGLGWKCRVPYTRGHIFFLPWRKYPYHTLRSSRIQYPHHQKYQGTHPHTTSSCCRWHFTPTAEMDTICLIYNALGTLHCCNTHKPGGWLHSSTIFPLRISLTGPRVSALKTLQSVICFAMYPLRLMAARLCVQPDVVDATHDSSKVHHLQHTINTKLTLSLFSISRFRSTFRSSSSSSRRSRKMLSSLALSSSVGANSDCCSSPSPFSSYILMSRFARSSGNKVPPGSSAILASTWPLYRITEGVWGVWGVWGSFFGAC